MSRACGRVWIMSDGLGVDGDGRRGGREEGNLFGERAGYCDGTKGERGVSGGSERVVGKE